MQLSKEKKAIYKKTDSIKQNNYMVIYGKLIRNFSKTNLAENCMFLPLITFVCKISGIPTELFK